MAIEPTEGQYQIAEIDGSFLTGVTSNDDKDVLRFNELMLLAFHLTLL